jgi:hypothetical protein
MVDKNIYEQNAQPQFKTEDGYWPLEELPESMIF